MLLCSNGEVVKKAQQKKVELLPVDSEPSAVWQALRSGQRSEVKKIWLTCSGGPFLNAEKFPKQSFSQITPQNALRHPKWQMGQKISIDSATLMNKAFELIEFVYLFDFSPEQIEVVIHPEAMIHSAVEFCDGSVVAQMSEPDMRIPISHALFFPDRAPQSFQSFSFFDQQYTFTRVDESRFPSIRYARLALQQNKSAELCRANDEAVKDFLDEKIRFDEIFMRIKEVFDC